MEQQPRIWLVDDDSSLREILGQMVVSSGYVVEGFASGIDVLDHPGPPPDAVLLDLMMPGLDGVEVLKELRRRHPVLPVVVLTGVSDVSRAVEVIRLGAYDYLVKPVEEERLITALRHAVAHRSLVREVARLKGELGDRYHLRNLVGSSEAMRRVYDQISKVVESDISVIVSGESGTGKELVAKAIHYGSSRAEQPFIGVNCVAIPEGLQESELFGHEKGAFTGAVTTHPGKFEQAQGGTIFLDEVGEMSPSSQVRLLRVLQERALQRVGGTRTIELDVRVISASNSDLSKMVSDGQFRQDLFYRLVVFPVELPALRERKEDLPLLVRHFLAKYAEDAGKEISRVHPVALEKLAAYWWPGNVRELENVIHRSLLVSAGPELVPEDLPAELSGLPVRDPIVDDLEVLSLSEVEHRAIARALDVCHGNLSDAARRLGIGRSTLYRKMSQYGITSEGRSRSS